MKHDRSYSYLYSLVLVDLGFLADGDLEVFLLQLRIKLELFLVLFVDNLHFLGLLVLVFVYFLFYVLQLVEARLLEVTS